MLKTVTREVFSQTEGVSYSRLSKLASSPKAYKLSLEEDDTSSGLTLGSLVDTLLTEPEKLREKYWIMTAKKPESPMMQAFINALMNGADTPTAYLNSGYNIKYEAVLKKFENEGKVYYNLLLAAKGRELIDFETYISANKIVNDLKTNIFTRKYFEPREGVEILYQVPVIWDFVGSKLPSIYSPITIRAKSLIDITYIDHNEKIIQPIDIKTGAEGFMKAWWKYRYYIQGAMYYNALKYILPDDKYRVLNTKFIYADTNGFNSPIIYKMTEDDLYVGTHGYRPKTLKSYGQSCSCGSRDNHPTNTEVDYKYKGYIRLASEFIWHKENDKWDYSYDVYQSEGVVEIDSFVVKL